MLVLRPWLKPAVNRSFQAAEAWEGAARAIRMAAQTAASAAVVRGTYPAPSFSIRGTVPDRHRRGQGRKGPIYRVLTAVSQTPAGVVVSAGGSPAAAASSRAASSRGASRTPGGRPGFRRG